MNVELILCGNEAYRWTNGRDCHFIGYFYDKENVLYRDERAITYLKKRLETASLESICRTLDGCFCFIVNREAEILLISDCINFFPLFYWRNGNDLKISNQFQRLTEAKGSFGLNKNAVPEFELAGFVLAEETLDAQIFKTNANQICTITAESVHVRAYQNFLTDKFYQQNFEYLVGAAEKEIMKAAQRLIHFLDGRTAMVPLSGGYDSRLIVSLLFKLNYKNVICFTYGKPNSEVPLSKKVAEILGFRWHFVDFDKEDLTPFLDEEYSAYLRFAGNGFAMPYLKEYFALKVLETKGLVPDDSVFLPGHSGDFLGGSYVLKTVKNTAPDPRLAQFIAAKYFLFRKKNTEEKDIMTSRVRRSLLNIRAPQVSNYRMEIEEWDIQEKLSKFIFHSSQVFVFKGYEVYFPLWTRPLRQYFRALPYVYRENKKLYNFVLEERFFKPQNIFFPRHELSPSQMQLKFQKAKDKVRYVVPWRLVEKKVVAADWPHYQKLTLRMRRDLEEEKSTPFKYFKSFNAIVAKWYIGFLEGKFKVSSKDASKNV